MRVHEYQAKELLRQYEIPVISGIAAFSAQEAVEAAQKIGGCAWRIKAQLQAQLPGLNELNHIATSLNALKDAASEFLEASVAVPYGAVQVRRLLVEEFVNVGHVLHFSITTDLDKLAIICSVSQSNSINGEQRQIELVPLEPLSKTVLSHILDDVSLPNPVVEQALGQVVDICAKAYELYQDKDLVSLDLSIAFVQQREQMEVIDVQMCFDGNALFRQHDINVLKDLDEENHRSLEASFYNTVYLDLDARGSVGCISHGGGLTLAVADLLKRQGGQVASIADLEDVITEEKLHSVFEIMQTNKAVKIILLYLIAEVVNCLELAHMIIKAAQSAHLDVPLIVCVKGKKEQEAADMLLAASPLIRCASNLLECTKEVIGFSD